MSDDFLSRWSRRKIAARAPAPAAAPPPEALAPQAVPPAAPLVSGDAPVPEPRPLPPTESLTFESDFTAFMQAGVDATVRRTALKTLLNDPRFNVMDGLDVYIDDYSIADPLPAGWLEKMTQNQRLGDYAPIQEAEDRAVLEEARLARAGALEEATGVAETPLESDTSSDGSKRAELTESAPKSAPGKGPDPNVSV